MTCSARGRPLRLVGGSLVFMGAVQIILAPAVAEAIPAFARKYQTSCQTCHIAYPKLNPFGETFRLRGYRMPAETEELIKETPIPLGAPGYKRLWPQAVWPADIPGTVPLSVHFSFDDVSRRRAEEAADGEIGREGTTTKNDFLFPAEVELLSAGTLGESLSFFAAVGFETEVEDGAAQVGIEIEHGQLNFNGPFGWGTAFNLKVGRIAPETAQPFGEPSLLTTDGPATLFEYFPIAAGGGFEVGGHEIAGIGLPHSVDGLEAYGIVAHRFFYSVGLANGIGPGTESMDGNSAKDIFGRVAYKIGGLALDGAGYTPSDKNWREMSLRLAVFAYRGDGKGVFFETGGHTGEEMRLLEDRTFTRAGFDANLFLQDLNVIAGYVRGRDTLAEYEEEATGPRLREQDDFVYHTWFAEGDYVLQPWLHAALRYEWLRPANRELPDFKRIVPNLTALIRANVKATLEYRRDLGESDNYLVLATLRFGF